MVDDQLAVLLRDAEHPHDRHQRQPLRDSLDEVAFLLLFEVVDHRPSVLADSVLDRLHLARLETLGNEAAEDAMPGVVGGEERLRGLEHLLRDVLEHHALPGAKSLGIARDGADVVVAHHGPVAATALLCGHQRALRLRLPRDRVLGAKPREGGLPVLRSKCPELL